MCQQIHIKERGPRVSKPPTQTARPPYITASCCVSYQCFSLVGSLLPPPQSRRSLGEARRMGRGWVAQSCTVPHPPPLNPSLQASLIFFPHRRQQSASRAQVPQAACHFANALSDPRRVRTSPIALIQLGGLKKKNIDKGRQDKA